MAVSKVVYGGNVLIDLTGDTIESHALLSGYTAHGANGDLIDGQCDYDANTQDATATAAEILSGKTAYNKANKVTGTMKNNGAVSGNITTKTGQYTVPQGYHDGSGKVGIASSEQQKIVPENIRSGITLLGVTGSMSGTEGANPQQKEVTPSVSEDVVVLPDNGYNFLSQVTVKKVPYTESQNSAGGITVTIG